MSSADIPVDAETAIENEIEASILSLSTLKSGRISRADHEIPIKFAEIKGLEKQIEVYKQDREICQLQLRILDRRLAELRSTR